MSDPKPKPRERDPRLLRTLHRQRRECALCGATGRLSLHHVHRHPRDDVHGNLVMLCGSGTTGCHGAVEEGDRATLEALYWHIEAERPDTLAYLAAKLGGEERADAWLRRYVLRA